MAEKLIKPQNVPKKPERAAPKVFHAGRYKDRGEDAAQMSITNIGGTDVDKVIAPYKGDSSRRILYGNWGDPVRYGLGPYEGFFRHKGRIFSLEKDPTTFTSYCLSGDTDLKEILAAGWRGSPNPFAVDKVQVYITPGVAGALKLICQSFLLPPSQPNLSPALDLLRSSLEGISNGPSDSSLVMPALLSIQKIVQTEYDRCSVRDNVVVPLWTYVSHMASVYGAQGRVNVCDIQEDGQVDLDSFEKSIDRNTRAVIFATVGNPLPVAMHPEKFDEILRIVDRKMNQYGHPILVVADTIYEHFRNQKMNRIDPIQRAMVLQRREDVFVPIIDMCSFSKMLAMPGQRVGYARIRWEDRLFPEERHDFFLLMNAIEGIALGTVPMDTQRALAKLYTSINLHSPVEEELAPIATVLKVLQDLPSSSHEHTDGYYSVKRVTKMVEDLAVNTLSAYKFAVTRGNIQEIAERLEKAGIIDMRYIEDSSGKSVPHFKLSIESLPKIPQSSSGKIELADISNDLAWREFAEITYPGLIEREDLRYDAHKAFMRRESSSRTVAFAEGVLSLQSMGRPVHLHPALLDGSQLNRDNLSAFYVLFSFDHYQSYHGPDFPSQAAQIASECIKYKFPIPYWVPAELFIPPDLRSDETSYIRNVSLQGSDEMAEMLNVMDRLTRLPTKGIRSDRLRQINEPSRKLLESISPEVPAIISRLSDALTYEGTRQSEALSHAKEELSVLFGQIQEDSLKSPISSEVSQMRDLLSAAISNLELADDLSNASETRETVGSAISTLEKIAVFEPKPDSAPGKIEEHNRVLIMDDSVDVSTVMGKIFTKLGLRVTKVANGEDAIIAVQDAIAKGNPISTIFLDLNIPDEHMGGKQAALEIRAIDPNVRIFAVSGESDHEVMKNPTDHGFTGALGKPFVYSDAQKVLEPDKK
ncbi:aminotransferase class I/II-fold pyridoxal phosphate-dependent enzyme [Candidatus Micrarchaeota archaeon]|nr:aminotransferase class I/II-fold pyridoxal phosphate-dependent enzyme [Candidatus Micrarchaeota archaeon]MBU1681261.1 aminotransferase class I/II-fold pyridoxal phosphate-dependent enzyme [Candidatus Micrarchaeota archaeon]